MSLGQPEKKMDAAAAAGVDGIEVFELDLVVSDLSRRRCGVRGAFYCPTAVSTPLAEVGETREIDGRTYLRPRDRRLST